MGVYAYNLSGMHLVTRPLLWDKKQAIQAEGAQVLDKDEHLHRRQQSPMHPWKWVFYESSLPRRGIMVPGTLKGSTWNEGRR